MQSGIGLLMGVLALVVILVFWFVRSERRKRKEFTEYFLTLFGTKAPSEDEPQEIRELIAVVVEQKLETRADEINTLLERQKEIFVIETKILTVDALNQTREEYATNEAVLRQKREEYEAMRRCAYYYELPDWPLEHFRHQGDTRKKDNETPRTASGPAKTGKRRAGAHVVAVSATGVVATTDAVEDNASVMPDTEPDRNVH